MYNRAELIGNLGRDPELIHPTGGGTVCRFTMATSEKWRDKESGEMQERTEWHRIVVFGNLAEICGKYLHKGKQIYIGGRLQTRQWEDKEGVTRYTTEIVGREMKMLGRKSDGHSGAHEDDDIPF